MGDDDLAGLVESQPVSFGFLVALVLCPVVALEDVAQFPRGDSLTVVFYGYLRVFAVRGGAGDVYFRFFARVLERVVDEVLEHGLQEVRVAGDHRVGGVETEVNVERFVRRSVPTVGGGDRFEHLLQVERFRG